MSKPSPEAQSTMVVGALVKLYEVTQNPWEIDLRSERGELSPHDTLMTCIGTRRKVLFTPFYSGIQHDATLSTRLLRAQAAKRPFVEGIVAYSSSQALASVTLRMCLESDRQKALETAWQYALPIDTRPRTTEDVLGGLDRVEEDGEAIEARTGEVHLTSARQNANHWGVSVPLEPRELVPQIHGIVTRGVSYLILE